METKNNIMTILLAILAVLLAGSVFIQHMILHQTIRKQDQKIENLDKTPVKAQNPTYSGQIEQEKGPNVTALGNMTVTIYHAVPEQTDSTPLITASGLDLEGLEIDRIRVCALSRDLLARWGGPIEYGDQIYIDLPDPDLAGWWTVEDTMAKRWRNHIDLLVPTSRKGGKWTNIEAWTIND